MATEQENKEKQLKSVMYLFGVRALLAVALFGIFDLSNIPFWRSLLGVMLFAIFYDLGPVAKKLFRVQQ